MNMLLIFHSCHHIPPLLLGSIRIFVGKILMFVGQVTHLSKISGAWCCLRCLTLSTGQVLTVVRQEPGMPSAATG